MITPVPAVMAVSLRVGHAEVGFPGRSVGATRGEHGGADDRPKSRPEPVQPEH